MTKVISSTELVQCYICLDGTDKSTGIEVPITTGGTVWTHPKCMEMYMKRVTQTPAACGGCSGDAGCC